MMASCYNCNLRNYNNVNSTKSLIVNQCVSNSPSKIRGGRGALMLLKDELSPGALATGGLYHDFSAVDRLIIMR